VLNKRPEDITINDIHALVDSRQPEGERIDYKINLNFKSSDEKKEFLRNLTSFANTHGGYLALGIEEDKGIPTGNIPGLEIDNLDQFKLTLENVIRDSIEPRLFSHTIREFKLGTGNYIVIIHIARSWNPPHRALDDRFYSRNSAGKYSLSVEQLRRVFTQGADTIERIRRFVRERAFLINANDGPVKLFSSKPKVILHILPLASFEGNLILPIGNNLLENLRGIYPLGELSSDHSYNADGILWHTTHFDQTRSYFQLFRNGVLEGVNCNMSSENSDENSESILHATYIEEQVCESLYRILKGLQKINIESFLVVSLSITGIKGYCLPRSRSFSHHGKLFPRDFLFLPEITLEEIISFLDRDIDEAKKSIAPKLKLMFDAMWQSFGYPHSPNFSGNVWSPKD
jgi:Putative DNA-binding domain